MEGHSQAGRGLEAAQLMGKALTALFWIHILNIVSGILSLSDMVGWFPRLYLPGRVVNFIGLLLAVMILLRLNHRSYRKAGWCGAVGILAGFVMNGPLMSEKDADWIWIFPVLVWCGLLGSVYFQYQGHARALQGIDDKLAGKWTRLRRWFAGLLAACVVGAMVLFLMDSVIGGAVSVAALGGILVVALLSLAYLYKMAREF